MNLNLVVLVIWRWSLWQSSLWHGGSYSQPFPCIVSFWFFRFRRNYNLTAGFDHWIGVKDKIMGNLSGAITVNYKCSTFSCLFCKPSGTIDVVFHFLFFLVGQSDRVLYFSGNSYFLRHFRNHNLITCLLYTSDAADEEDSVDLGGRRIIKKK